MLATAFLFPRSAYSIRNHDGIKRMTSRTPLPSPAGRLVTSYDVAKLAGVSQSAVSRCFTPGASVSAKTRARIKKAADALGYKPNAIARMLITKRSNLVAVIVANLEFNPDFTSTISRLIAERGLNILFFTLDHEADADRVIDQVWQYRVDGVLSAAELSERHILMLHERGLPLVFLNRFYDAVAINSVCCDQAAGERWLVDQLIAAGHQRFAIVAGPADSAVSHQRVQGARDRLAAGGLAAPQLAHGDFTYDGGRAAMRSLVEDGCLPDAVLCANDMMALGCMDEARFRLGLRVPDQISIVGFDGLAPGGWASYQLTTIRQPTYAMVSAAIDMLSARFDDPSLATEKRVFGGEPIRGSSARLA